MIGYVVQHKPGGLFGRIVDDVYQLCAEDETAVAFWERLYDDRFNVPIVGYLGVPTVDLLIIDGGTGATAEHEESRRKA